MLSTNRKKAKTDDSTISPWNLIGYCPHDISDVNGPSVTGCNIHRTQDNPIRAYIIYFYIICDVTMCSVGSFRKRNFNFMFCYAFALLSPIEYFIVYYIRVQEPWPRLYTLRIQYTLSVAYPSYTLSQLYYPSHDPVYTWVYRIPG